MDGVTILNTVEKCGFSIWGLIIFVLLCAVSIFLLLYLFIRSLMDGNSEAFLVCMTIVCGVVAALVGCALWGPTYSEYKVIVDESVSFKEFTDKYEVVGQEGEIYTVVERTDN